jgi:hypothetical protein
MKIHKMDTWQEPETNRKNPYSAALVTRDPALKFINRYIKNDNAPRADVMILIIFSPKKWQKIGVFCSI